MFFSSSQKGMSDKIAEALCDTTMCVINHTKWKWTLISVSVEWKICPKMRSSYALFFWSVTIMRRLAFKRKTIIYFSKECACTLQSVVEVPISLWISLELEYFVNIRCRMFYLAQNWIFWKNLWNALVYHWKIGFDCNVKLLIDCSDSNDPHCKCMHSQQFIDYSISNGKSNIDFTAFEMWPVFLANRHLWLQMLSDIAKIKYQRLIQMRCAVHSRRYF